MIRLEIAIGRILRDCTTTLDKTARVGLCNFKLTDNEWVCISNTSDSILHILLPGNKEDKLLHIIKNETVVYDLVELLARGWQERIIIVKADEIIPFSIMAEQTYCSEKISMDFFKAQMLENGVKIIENQYGLREIIWMQIVTGTGQKETTYLKTVPLENSFFNFIWNKLFLDKKGKKQIQFLVSFQKDSKKEENQMGIISKLLSGGILIGKICQGIAGAFSSMVTDEATGIMVSTENLAFDDVKFMMLKGSGDNAAKLTALNCSNESKRIQFPIDANGNSLMTDIPGGEKVVIEEQVKAANPTEIIEISTAENLSKGKNLTPTAKVLLNGLHIGDATSKVFVYGFTFHVDENGIWIGGGSVDALNYLKLSSESGISVMYNDVIRSSASGEFGKFFPIDWRAFGLNKGDILSGEIHFSYADNEARNVKMLPTQPLTEEEKRFLIQQGIL